MSRMRLDFTNKALEDWIKICPFPITVQQAVTEPKACKHITIDITIEANKTKPNPDFVASDQLKFLELKYIEVDKKLNQLTRQRFQVDNALIQRKISKQIHHLLDEKHEIEKQLDVQEKS